MVGVWSMSPETRFLLFYFSLTFFLFSLLSTPLFSCLLFPLEEVSSGLDLLNSSQHCKHVVNKEHVQHSLNLGGWSLLISNEMQIMLSWSHMITSIFWTDLNWFCFCLEQHLKVLWLCCCNVQAISGVVYLSSIIVLKWTHIYKCCIVVLGN